MCRCDRQVRRSQYVQGYGHVFKKIWAGGKGKRSNYDETRASTSSLPKKDAGRLWEPWLRQASRRWTRAAALVLLVLERRRGECVMMSWQRPISASPQQSERSASASPGLAGCEPRPRSYCTYSAQLPTQYLAYQYSCQTRSAMKLPISSTSTVL